MLLKTSSMMFGSIMITYVAIPAGDVFKMMLQNVCDSNLYLCVCMKVFVCSYGNLTFGLCYPKVGLNKTGSTYFSLNSLYLSQIFGETDVVAQFGQLARMS